ncbi:MAG: NUDIX domain-containing protein [Treponema sp.]|jgi:8-oxo-dGTP diphosphatase|nr:NUDIX domain-containing protein [Treponema sp.]
MNSVAGIIIENRKIFIAKRNAKGDIGERWEFPGGKVEDGETDEQALAREYDEEFGVGITAGTYIGSAKFEHHGKQHTVRAYKALLLSRDFVMPEHTALRWASIDDIEALIQDNRFVPSDALLLPFIKETLQLHHN